MTLHLPPHVHYCEIGDERIFLDLHSDRYFKLPHAADRAFTALLEGSASIPPELRALSESGILVAAPAGRAPAPTIHPDPGRSLLEETAGSELSWRTFPEVLLLVLWARSAVRRKQLPRLLRPTSSKSHAASPAGLRRDEAVRAFLEARPLVPVAANCLYDSLAMHRFLARRSIPADIVIGAKLQPFGAHCWLQDGTTVLNDTLASARGFAPILVA